jgi:hypothetical protein
MITKIEEIPVTCLASSKKVSAMQFIGCFITLSSKIKPKKFSLYFTQKLKTLRAPETHEFNEEIFDKLSDNIQIQKLIIQKIL